MHNSALANNKLYIFFMSTAVLLADSLRVLCNTNNRPLKSMAGNIRQAVWTMSILYEEKWNTRPTKFLFIPSHWQTVQYLNSSMMALDHSAAAVLHSVQLQHSHNINSQPVS